MYVISYHISPDNIHVFFVKRNSAKINLVCHTYNVELIGDMIDEYF